MRVDDVHVDAMGHCAHLQQTPFVNAQIHHLVGHQHKVTCVRLFGSGRNVITGSADRSLKIWDIGQKTYRQTVTLRHGSSCNCVDVAADSVTAASGHLDGGNVTMNGIVHRLVPLKTVHLTSSF